MQLLFRLMTPSKENGVAKEEVAAVEWVIANAINKTARGDPDAVAARIIGALDEAG
jgi:hypothetical protein